MKILLCYPPVSDEYDKIRDAGVAPHLSLLCLATHIKNSNEGIEIILSDGHHDSYEDICELILKEKPNLIGFSVDFTNYNTSVKLSKYAKDIDKSIMIGCGSNHASNMYKSILENQNSIDFICINDGEECFSEYIKYLNGYVDIKDVPNLAYKKDGDVIVNPIKIFDLERMFPVEYELMNLDKYFMVQKEVFGNNFKMLQFTTQRGCANHPLCVFCGRYDDGMRFRDPILCAKEVAHYVEKYELTEVWDRSDSFIQNIKWLKTFSDELNKLTNRFTEKKTTFKTYSRADQLLRQDVIDILKSLNFRMVFVGYEAGDDRILKNIGKHSNTSIYLEATKKVLENGIDIDASFIVGLPGENKESLNNHVKFVKELASLGLKKIRVNRLLVLPGTPLYREILNEFPEYIGKDIVPMKELQTRVFQTNLYDLKEFNNDVNLFVEELDKTSHEMSLIIEKKGGAVEGYGHGKGKNIASGQEVKSE